LTQRFTRRGDSNIIAMLLLISMAVTLSVLFYARSVGLLGSLLPPPQQSGYENPTIEMISFSSSTGPAQLTVRNIGTRDSKVTSIYVDGVLIYSNPQGALILPGQAQTFTLPGVSATQHYFSVRTLDGGGVKIYGPPIIYVLATMTGITTITSSSSTFTTTYTTIYTSTFTSTVSTTTSATTTSTWTSTNPSTYTTTTANMGGSGFHSQTVTTSLTSTGATTQASTIISTTTSTGVTTVTSTATTTTNASSPFWLIFLIFLPWSTIRSKLIGKPSLPRRRQQLRPDLSLAADP